MSDSPGIIRETLSRRDPQGYYVIPCRQTILAVLEKYGVKVDAVEDAGDTVFLKTRSRQLARRIASIALKHGLLAV